MNRAIFAAGFRPGAALISVILIGGLILFSVGCVLHENGGGDGEESSYGWTWVAGSSTVNAVGVYGTKGVPAAGNLPGARGYQALIVGSDGKVWMSAGHGTDAAGAKGHLNDLWKYDPATQQWAWISGGNVADVAGVYGTKGVPSVDNAPGSRDSHELWKDAGGNLWLFGGFGFDSSGTTGDLNDMWVFDPTSLEWTWISGSNSRNQSGVYGTKGVPDADNVPGARVRATSWTDGSGKFWVFGGVGSDAAGNIGDLNDLWKFDPVTKEWAWMGGSDVREQHGVYGTKGVASVLNQPGARDASAVWQGTDGKFYLFGGEGFDGIGGQGQLSDLWSLNPATLEWTWVSGNALVNQIGVYGTKGTASPSNVPGGNNGSCAWVDSSGRLWLFGGRGYDATGSLGYLGDLWKYDVAAGQWTWVFGNKTAFQQGHYGAKGKRYLSNIPGGRFHLMSWVGANGDLWLFGGTGIDGQGSIDYLNDVWKYTR